MIPEHNLCNVFLKHRMCTFQTDKAKEFYEDEHKQAFHDLHALMAKDWARLERDGFYVGKTLVYPIVLGCKGDWSYHAAWSFRVGVVDVCSLCRYDICIPGNPDG